MPASLTLLRRASALALAAGLVAGVAAAPARAAANPYERGPAPTRASIEAERGPFATAELAAQNPAGFRAAKIYYPTDASQGTFGVLVFSPGFLSSWFENQWLGHRLASQGFVVVGFDTLSPFDQPAARADQALAALDNALADPRLAGRVDPSRVAVAGYSMGGGASLSAAAKRPGIKAIVPIVPWHQTKSWSSVQVPALVIAGEGDWIAPEADHAEPFYASLAGEKAYLEIKGGSHFFGLWFDNPTTGAHLTAWLKRWLDDDTRYTQFPCPGPALGPTISAYHATCPL